MAASFLTLAATASAQDILITPKMRVGDTFTLEISRTRENVPASRQDGKGRATIDVTVLTATPEGSTIEWESGSTAGSVAGLPEALMLTASNAMRGMKPVIRLTADGAVVGLVNEAEVLAKMQAAVDVIRRDLVDKVPPANRQGLEVMLGQLLSPTLLLGSVVRDAETYFGLSGVELAVGESITADLMQPNPLGGGSLPAKFTVRLDSATADSASLVTTTVYDGSELMRATLQLMEKAGEPVAPEEIAKFPAMQLADEGQFVFDRSVGLMREVVSIRRVTVAGRSRLDRIEIRLAAPPRR
jgi:hypothetical protein